MSCMFAPIQGGSPMREIFPLPLDDVDALCKLGETEMRGMLGISAIKDLDRAPLTYAQFFGAALKPDGAAFYLTTLAPAATGTPQGIPFWRGAFFAHFGVGDIVGTVEGTLQGPSEPTLLTVAAELRLDEGKARAAPSPQRTAEASASWTVHGSQATRANKLGLIGKVDVTNRGPHDPADIRRCIALHAPDRAFGELRAVVAMQCGVAAAALIEAIC